MSETARVTVYDRARVKFNDGYGALLCNGCGKVIKTGFDHENREHYCSPACGPACEPMPMGGIMYLYATWTTVNA